MSMNVTINVDSISLECIASGFPLPTITWFQNDTMIDDDSRISIMLTSYDSMTGLFMPDSFGTVISVLTIENATVNDTGRYRCDAESAVDVYEIASSTEALVLVQGLLI